MPTVTKALEILRDLVDHAAGVDVVVCCAVWKWARRLADSLEAACPSLEFRRDVDRVVAWKDGVSLHFLPIGDGNKVRGQAEGRSVMLVTDAMPEDAIGAALAGRVVEWTRP